MTEKKTATQPVRRKTAQPKAAKAKAAKTVRITLVRSPISSTYRHKATLIALGLKHIRQTVDQVDTPQLRGMLSKVNHMVKVEAGTGKEKPS
jgi:large subunit ribosomal protein L30